MKNKKIMKKISVDLTQASVDARVSECMGLMNATVGGRKVLTVSPRLDSKLNGCHTPLAAFCDGNGREHILTQCSHPFRGLTVWSDDERTDMPTDDVASCALAVSNGFVVMTSRGPARVVRDAEGGWSYSEHFTCPAQVRLTAQRVGALTAYTKPMSLTDTDFTRLASTLSDAGEKKLASELSDAYAQLAATAVSGCNWIQPIQARYRLIGELGEVVYTSTPVALCPDGWQADEEVTAVCTKRSGDVLDVPRIGLTVNAFRMNVDISEESLAKMRLSGVKTIELWATPQVHPFDPSARASYRISRETSDAPALTIAIPGAMDGFTPRSAQRLRQFGQLEQMIDEASERVAVIDVATIAGAFQCMRSDDLTPEDETAAVKRICESAKASKNDTADPAAALISEIASPHAFVAATVAVSGDTVVWGDITPVPAQTVSVEAFTTNFIDEPYEGVLIVERTDGTRNAMAVSGSAMPSAWAPQVSFPESGVREIELYVRSKTGATCLHGRLTLQPGAAGLRSIYLNAKLESTPLDPWTGAMPSADNAPAGKRRPGALVTCRLTQPLLPMAALECCHSPIRAIHPALRSRSSWDFSKARFYALSADAIHAVSVSPQRSSLSASAMDSRGIAAARASVYTPLGIMALHGGNLLKISGATVDTIASGLEFQQLAWDDDWQSLWLLSESGAMRMFDPRSGFWADIDSPANFIAVSSVGNYLWLTDEDELYRPQTRSEQRTDAMRRNLALQCDVPLPAGLAANAIELRMSATDVDLLITLSAQPGPALNPQSRLLKLKIHGDVTTPLIMRFPALRRPFLSLKIQGASSPDILIHSININAVSHDKR